MTEDIPKVLLSMKTEVLSVIAAVSLLVGCASNENACEDVTLAAEQVQQCQLLQKQIAQKKDNPILRTELERRYEEDCINVRFYRDDKTSAICGNKEKIDQIEEALEKETKKK
ncbi:hypothetical protein ACFSJY_15910 [Thalassotalea euphylliae]|uniref:hypothetical protein n=1 Tax=Thalassotalea euphylliae TaxID=1655234 RepID=UPI00363E5A10